MTVLIAFSVLVFLASLIIGLANLLDEDAQPKYWTPFLQFIFGLALTIMIGNVVSKLAKASAERETYQKVLYEENTYEMKILYDVQQDTIVPYDTIFILKTK